MRIGIEAQRLFRKKKHGMEVVTLELVRHLQKIDQDNEYVIFIKDDEDTDCLQSTANFKILKTPAFSYPFWEQVYLPRLARRAGLDVLHCTSNTAPVFYSPPKILTLHDIIFLEKVSFAGTAYQNFGNLYRRFIAPAAIRQCSTVVTVSVFEQRRIIEKLGLPEDKVKVVYNGISKKFRIIEDSSALKKMAEKYSLPEQFILFFGNTAPKKNIVGVVEAYIHYFEKETNPLHLVIIDCTVDYIRKVLNKINTKQKEDILKKLLILDYIPFDDLPFVYNLSNLFLYPSLRESFGMPVIEAMACGTPVITSNVSSMPEVAGDAALLTDPENPVEIAEGIKKILDNPELQQQMIRSGLRRSAGFSWTNTARQVLQLYKCFAAKNFIL